MTNLGKPPRRNHFHTNNSGFTLVGVLMVLVVLSVLGLSILMITSNSVKLSGGERDDQSVFYIAEAGLTVEMDEIEGKIQLAYSNTNDVNSFFNELFSEIVKSAKPSPAIFEETFGETKAIIDVEELSSGNPTRQYKVTSTGIIDKKSRVVERELSVTWVPKSGLGNMAVFVEDKITLTGSSKIYGSVGTNKSGAGTVDLAWSTDIIGDIYVPSGSEDVAVIHGNPAKKRKGIGMDNPTPIVLPNFPVFSEFDNLLIEKSSQESNKGYKIENGILSPIWHANQSIDTYTLKLKPLQRFEKIDFNKNTGGGRTIYFDVGNTDKRIVVDNLNMESGHIKLIGTGKLSIYVKGNIIFDGSSSINDGGLPERLNIFLKASPKSSNPKSFRLGGSQKLFGSIFAEDANITLTNSGGFNGNLFTGGSKVDISGHAFSNSPLILAPNAKLVLSNSGSVKGMIVAYSYESPGNAIMTHGEIDIKDGPISSGAIPRLGGSGDVIVERNALREK